jgi:hypothetical protein
MNLVFAMRAPIRLCACWLVLAWSANFCFSQAAIDDRVFADGFDDIVFADGFEAIGPTFGETQTFTLALPPAPSPVSIVLDRSKLNSVINAAEQQQLVLRTVDPAPALSATLAAMVNQCGTGWQFDSPNPNYDCSATGWLGVGGDWHTSNEYNLVRLLTLTSANSYLSGTTVEDLTFIASTVGIGGGAQQMIADLLGISLTTELTKRPDFVTAYISNVVATHPSSPAGTLPVRLYDAMNNMATWTTLLGPASNGHPGFFDSSGVPSTQVLGTTFSITANGISNVHAHQGLVLGPSLASAGTLATIVDTTGPSFNDPAELALDAPSLVVSALPAATVTPRFLVREQSSYIYACTSFAAFCATSSPVWSLPAWSLERLVTTAARSRWMTATNRDKCYIMCAAEITVGYNGDPAGWVQFYTEFGIGDPPPHQYVWEMVDELEQVTIHRIGPTSFLAEGQANIAWKSALDVTVSSATLATVVAPALAAHASQIATLAAGNWQAGNADVDLYLRAGDDGSVQLWFPTASDPRPSAAYPYTRIGFFDDVALSAKVSETLIAGTGDTAHEKLVLTAGTRVVYAQAATGETWRVSVTYSASATTAAVEVAPLL